MANCVVNVYTQTGHNLWTEIDMPELAVRVQNYINYVEERDGVFRIMCKNFQCASLVLKIIAECSSKYVFTIYNSHTNEYQQGLVFGRVCKVLDFRQSVLYMSDLLGLQKDTHPYYEFVLGAYDGHMERKRIMEC